VKPGASRERVRCRLINGEDLDAVLRLLQAGFPGHKPGSWKTGLERMTRRSLPLGAPRYGYCLDVNGEIAGVILLIASSRRVNGEDTPFVNVASWYVIPRYRAYAQLLVSMALRNKTVTYTNVTPAPHTWPIVESQGYTRYCHGLFYAAAILTPPARDVSVMPFAEVSGMTEVRSVANFDMLKRHHELGCKVVIVRDGQSLSGYVFQKYCIRRGRIALPALLVLHGPDRQQLVRITGNLGRHFLRHAAPFLVMDANGPVDGLRGFYTSARGRKYFKGPHQPALCDLADSEFSIFGV
jgi:hypothetical protein